MGLVLYIVIGFVIAIIIAGYLSGGLAKWSFVIIIGLTIITGIMRNNEVIQSRQSCIQYLLEDSTLGSSWQNAGIDTCKHDYTFWNWSH